MGRGQKRGEGGMASPASVSTVYSVKVLHLNRKRSLYQCIFIVVMR